MSADAIYFRHGVGKVGRSRPIFLPEGTSQVGLRFTGHRTNDTDAVIAPGLLCYSDGEAIGAAGAGTFVEPPSGPYTVTENGDNIYPSEDEAIFSIGAGGNDIPVGTVAVIGVCYIDAGEFRFLEMGGEPVQVVLGGRVRRSVERLTDTIRRIDEIGFADENAATSLVTIEEFAANALSLIRDARAQLYGDATANPPVPSVEARWTDAIALEVGPTGATGQLISSLNLAVNDPSTGLATKVDATHVTNAIAAIDLASYTTFSNLEAAVNHPATGLATRVSQTEIDQAIATLDLATYTAFNNLSLSVTNNTNAIASKVDATHVTNAIAAIDLASYTAFNNIEAAVNNPTTGLASRAAQTDLTNLQVTVDNVRSIRHIGVDANDQAAGLYLLAADGTLEPTGVLPFRVPGSAVMLNANDAFFALFPTFAELNVPIRITDGGNGAYLQMINGSRQTVIGSGFGASSDLDFWKGPSGIAITAMTLQNGVMADGVGAGSSGNPYIGGQQYKFPAVGFAISASTISGGGTMTPQSNGFVSQGGNESVTLRFKRVYRKEFTSTDPSQHRAPGLFDLGQFTLRLARYEDGTLTSWPVSWAFTPGGVVSWTTRHYDGATEVFDSSIATSSELTSVEIINADEETTVTVTGNSGSVGKVITYALQLQVDPWGTTNVTSQHMSLSGTELLS